MLVKSRRDLKRVHYHIKGFGNLRQNRPFLWMSKFKWILGFIDWQILIDIKQMLKLSLGTVLILDVKIEYSMQSEWFK